jgi:hypothetical protein
MATVVLPYTYVKGAVLDATGHNRNSFSLTPGEGVYSEPNGGLDGANLSSTFTVNQDLVQPEQVTFARAAGARSTLDNMGDVNLCDQDGSVDATLESQALPGCGLRVYLPFDASMVLWEVGFFWHCSRFMLPDAATEQGAFPQSSKIITKLMVDGVAQDYTRREYPPTLFQNYHQESFVDNGIARSYQQELRTTERAMSQYRDISHLALTASEVSAGWHELSLSFFVQPRPAARGNPVVLDTVRRYSGAGTVAIKKVNLECRWTVGCRNARVLAIL